MVAEKKKTVEFGDMKEMERLRKEEEKVKYSTRWMESARKRDRKTKIERVTESKRQRESSEEMRR